MRSEWPGSSRVLFTRAERAADTPDPYQKLAASRAVVTIKTQRSLTDARKYFEKHLAIGDYYEQGQTVSGEWFGEGASRMMLAGHVGRKEFLALCENHHPASGETLTQRQLGHGTAKNHGERRVFYDFTFSPPKSVSIVALVTQDAAVVDSHHRALHVALKEFEAFASTRVRKGGGNRDRLTSNVVAALFTHEASRALDPHLHTHCIVFNATFDDVEGRWKALQNYDMLRARKFVESVYYHELAKDLGKLGYQIRSNLRGDFEIEGVSPELCKRFSKRHEQIEKELSQLLKEKPELASGNLADFKEYIAQARRARKIENISQEELRRLWRGQLTESEWTALGLSRSQAVVTDQTPGSTQLEECVTWAESHLFDRNSVVLECTLWEQALGRARGQNVSVSELKQFTRARDYIRDESRPLEVTLREVLLREWDIVNTAKQGVGTCHPLVSQPQTAPLKLDEEQQGALGRLLTSTNAVTVFRGGAGTGKSFVLRALVEQLEHCGRHTVVLAPQRQQVVEMEKSGFPSPTTVASFLLKQDTPANSVILVDEAGQIGGRQMHELIRLVQDRGARLILSGDTRQHGPVEASDALIAIERHSGVKPIELQTIRRQDPALGEDQQERMRIRMYRQAVEAAASGDLAESLKKLEEMGAVITCGMHEQTDKLAEEYVRLMEQNASVVVVSQTWGEVHRVNSKVRDALKSKGLLGATDSIVQALDKLDLTNAQKRDQRFYPSEAVVLFNQRVRGAEPGTQGKLAGIVKVGVLVETDGHYVTVSNKVLDHITVCVPRELSLAQGDRLQIKANRKLASGDRVTNGEVVAVKSVRADGAVELSDGRILDTGFREFLPGYAITSYGSQGKTVDHVLFSDSTVKAATNAQQWYVTISRGRRGIRIFTSDKDQLRESLARCGNRPLAIDLVPTKRSHGVKPVWHRMRGYLTCFGERAADWWVHLKSFRSHRRQQNVTHEHHQNTGMLGERPERSRSQNRTQL